MSIDLAIYGVGGLILLGMGVGVFLDSRDIIKLIDRPDTRPANQQRTINIAGTILGIALCIIGLVFLGLTALLF